MQILKSENISIDAYVSRIGNISIPENISIDTSKTYHNILRCPHEATAQLMLNRIEEAAQSGDTLGGIISCTISGVPAGLGEPVFDKFHAQLGKAMLSINAVKGFEIGSGFSALCKWGHSKTMFLIQIKTEKFLPQPIIPGCAGWNYQRHGHYI